MGIERAIVPAGEERAKKTLEQIFEEQGLTKGQRMYLSLRLRGMERLAAAEKADREVTTVKTWESEAKFKQVENYLLANRESYEKEALEIFVNNLSAKAQSILNMLVDKGAEDWDKLDRWDKSCIMQALSLIAKGSIKKRDDDDKRSYEEIILRKHVEK